METVDGDLDQCCRGGSCGQPRRTHPSLHCRGGRSGFRAPPPPVVDRSRGGADPPSRRSRRGSARLGIRGPSGRGATRHQPGGLRLRPTVTVPLATVAARDPRPRPPDASATPVQIPAAQSIAVAGRLPIEPLPSLLCFGLSDRRVREGQRGVRCLCYAHPEVLHEMLLLISFW